MPNPKQHHPTRRFRSPSRLLGALLAAGLLLAASASAQTPEQVTPGKLAELLPAELEGLEVSWDESGFSAVGGATALREFLDPDDDSAGMHLALQLNDIGPFLDASLLALEADVRAGRLEKVEVGGLPGFLDPDTYSPEIRVVAGRIGITAHSHGPVIDREQLTGYVAGLPLEDIAALSGLDVAEKVGYPVQLLLQGSLRSFLPDEAAGFPRASGFYSELHPAGSASSGFGYEGDHGGEATEVVVMIADMGSAAPRTAEKLAADGAWEPFTEAGYDGFIRGGSEEPQAVLLVDRFRIEVSAFPPVLSAAELTAVFAEINLEPLLELAALLPETDIPVDPLVDSQPELLSTQALAGALPAGVDGLTLTEEELEEPETGSGWTQATAYGTYADADGEELLLLAIVDQGMVAIELQMAAAGMEEITVNGHDAWLEREAQWSFMVVDGRVAVIAEAAWGAEVDSDMLVALLESVDTDALLNVP